MSLKHKTIALKEFRENTQKYISEIGKGKSFIVFRRSKPVFKIAPADTWGDDGLWETVVDFTKHKSGSDGVLAKDVLRALKNISDKS